MSRVRRDVGEVIPHEQLVPVEAVPRYAKAANLGSLPPPCVPVFELLDGKYGDRDLLPPAVEESLLIGVIRGGRIGEHKLFLLAQIHLKR